jgi:hypothetical protein
MNLFRPFDPNPFRVNAFTIIGAPVALLSPSDLLDVVRGRMSEVDDRGKVEIPAGADRVYDVRAADLPGCEEVLRDPNARPREELLMPAPHPPQGIDGVEDFCRRHRLTKRAAESLLSLEPLAASHLLVGGLPEVSRDALQGAVSEFSIPELPPVRTAAAAFLVRASDRHV